MISEVNAFAIRSRDSYNIYQAYFEVDAIFKIVTFVRAISSSTFFCWNFFQPIFEHILSHYQAYFGRSIEEGPTN